MNEDLQERLRRLGVVKGTRHLKPATSKEAEALPAGPTLEPPPEWDLDEDPPPLEQLFPGGRLVESEDGACFLLDNVYPLQRRHGGGRLADLPPRLPPITAAFCRDERLANLPREQFLFLDTETTGLTGAGTLAFMVGAAFLEGEALITRQFFLRDHADETAMLQQLAGLLAERTGLITFNGRSFDLPLLDNRYLMNRIDLPGGPLQERPHLDLLLPARRLWRSRLGSCALSSLEANLLGVQRQQADVPGWAIPGLYFDYLRHGHAHEMRRVFYHNEIDLLSMVTLTGRIINQIAHPNENHPPQDLFSLARWQEDAGLPADAERSLRLLLEQELSLPLYHQTLQRLALLLKRQERYREALPLWQQLAVTSLEEVTGHIELAKYYEWREPDLAKAIYWTEQALRLIAGRHKIVQAEVEHRLARLKRKMG